MFVEYYREGEKKACRCVWRREV